MQYLKINLFIIIIIFLTTAFTFGQKRSSNIIRNKTQTKSIQKQIPKGWKLVDLDSFSFMLPESMEDKKVRGIDSQVWRFESDEVILGIDRGIYKVTFPAEDFKNFQKRVFVDRIHGQYFAIDYTKPKSTEIEIDANDKQKPYLDAIVFKHNKYFYSSFYIQYKSFNQKEIAEKILYSIKFKK